MKKVFFAIVFLLSVAIAAQAQENIRVLIPVDSLMQGTKIDQVVKSIGTENQYLITYVWKITKLTGNLTTRQKIVQEIERSKAAIDAERQRILDLKTELEKISD